MTSGLACRSIGGHDGAKSNAIDVDGLLRSPMAHCRGGPRVCRMVRPPSVPNTRDAIRLTLPHGVQRPFSTTSMEMSIPPSTCCRADAKVLQNAGFRVFGPVIAMPPKGALACPQGSLKRAVNGHTHSPPAAG